MLHKINPTETKVWSKLTQHYMSMQNVTLKELFADDDKRFPKYSMEFENIFFDYSKNLVNDETMSLLNELAVETKVRESIQMMFNGYKINETEERSVLHTALRNRSNSPVMIDGKDIMIDINAVLEKMRDFSNQVRNGEWKGVTGKAITDIVNIGIGGSDLGPVMVCNALKYYSRGNLTTHFISNVDGTHTVETLKRLDPETTLIIVVSKTFTTQETMANAETAKDWILKNIDDEDSIAKHFVAVSTNTKAVAAFGINTDNMFEFWDFVGGRFSLWSAVGLSIACSIGFDKFEELLDGAYSMDCHFKNTDIKCNIPIIMALLGVWYANFYNTQTEAILPYDQYLDRFPAYLQQAVMESNGKYADRNGNFIKYATSPVLWGEPGTNGQHSFYQLIHQGTQMIPCTFLAGAKSHNPIGNHQNMLISNFFAQTEALMNGKTKEEVRQELKGKMSQEEIDKLVPYKVFKGNIPTTSILYRELTPRTLGTLISLYEHKIFTQGVIWNIFSFDQWGVELGKQLANKILPELLSKEEVKTHDMSTNGLINRYKKWRV